ncbi:MAG: site-specific DNA-methyltransferase [Afipia sp.]
MNKPEQVKPERMDLRSIDVSAEKREELKRSLQGAFPEVFAEGKIDFDQFKRVLGEWVDPSKERFGLNWPGKAECMKVIQAPSFATLKPDRENSIEFDKSENLFIEGDNLEVLKLLQKSYFGEVKVIYIDPPYNTGNEFIYPDNYSETLETYLTYSGQLDDSGHKFSTNTEAAGRYHSRWLNMIYPRLYLAQNLLKEDGVFLVSIDDNEFDNLKKVCNEVFGEENFVGSMVWEKSRKNDARLISVGHEYILIYAKSLEHLKELNVTWREEKPGTREIWNQYLKLRSAHGSDNKKIEEELTKWFSDLPKTHPSKKWARYKRVDAHGPWRDDNISWPGGGGPTYDVIHPKTGKPCKVPERGWVFSSPETMKKMIDVGIIEFRDDHTEPPFRKSHLKPIVYDEIADAEMDVEADSESADDADDELATQVRGSYFYKQSQVTVKYLRKLMGAKVFDNPKDHDEIARLIKYVCGEDDQALVLDFFAGSGTTAHSVMQLNASFDTALRYVLVQLPEPISEKTTSGKAALKKGLKTVADIARERIKRAATEIGGSTESELDIAGKATLDLGFRAFKLDRSNFRLWDGGAEEFEASGKQIELHIEHLLGKASAEEILYELLLNAGFSLATKVARIELAGKTVFSIEDGSLLICLEKEITPQLIDALAEANPLQVICLDEGFKGNDQLKANAVQTFKARAQAEESEIVFRTV